jgi:hypothetical protein
MQEKYACAVRCGRRLSWRIQSKKSTAGARLPAQVIVSRLADHPPKAATPAAGKRRPLCGRRDLKIDNKGNSPTLAVFNGPSGVHSRVIRRILKRYERSCSFSGFSELSQIFWALSLREQLRTGALACSGRLVGFRLKVRGHCSINMSDYHASLPFP